MQLVLKYRKMQHFMQQVPVSMVSTAKFHGNQLANGCKWMQMDSFGALMLLKTPAPPQPSVRELLHGVCQLSLHVDEPLKTLAAVKWNKSNWKVRYLSEPIRESLHFHQF